MEACVAHCAIFCFKSHFLKDDRCTMHGVNPFGCAYFSAEQPKEQSDAMSARGLMEIMKSWWRGDLYAQLWAILYEAGRIAPSPLEARASMRAALNAGSGWRKNPAS
jgi:hypothetical protein